MSTSITLAALLERFFTQRLMQQRQASPHTISSYRDTFHQFLKFTEQRLGKEPSRLNFQEIDAPLIDTLEKQVDQEGVGLLIRFHPVASDMREVVSAMKVSTNLERVGDQSVTIARRAKRLNGRSLVSEVALLEPTYRLALAIFLDSIRAFAERDCALARTLKSRDKELDAVTTDIGERLVARASVDPENVPSYLDLIFIGRALERIGDHATNIAEDSFWRDRATDIRHTHKESESSP